MKYAYTSVLGQEIKNLIEMKQALGFSYASEIGKLKRIDTFFNDHNLDEKSVSKELCDEWCKKRSYETSRNHSSRISMMRVLCTYLNDIGISAYVPPKGLAGKKKKYDAHIYTDDELRRFFAEVDKSRSVESECPYRAMVMPLFFRLLYTSGFRVSELRLARICDFNLDEGYLLVRESKNHRDRIVPIAPPLVERCREIIEIVHKNSSDDEFFFLVRPGEILTLGNIYKNFRRYLEGAGISHTGRGPRVHDFRHTYCVNLLRKWTDEGKDLMAYIPYMRTMLGHEGFEETAYYLKLTYERYPYIKEALKKEFPEMIEEVAFSEKEFY